MVRLVVIPTAVEQRTTIARTLDIARSILPSCSPKPAYPASGTPEIISAFLKGSDDARIPQSASLACSFERMLVCSCRSDRDALRRAVCFALSDGDSSDQQRPVASSFRDHAITPSVRIGHVCGAADLTVRLAGVTSSLQDAAPAYRGFLQRGKPLHSSRGRHRPPAMSSTDPI